jgi:Family of unknown function (DUF5719)
MRAERHRERARGQGWLALLTILVVVGGGIALERGVGVATEPSAEPGTALTGSWSCPHGGGPRWTVQIHLANPGDRPVTARLTELSSGRPRGPVTVSVDPGATRTVDVTAKAREASTFVEYFGGWLAAGWVAQGGSGETGVAAEPCAAGSGRRWFAPDGTTEQGQDAYLVVMNPFDVPAAFDVALLTKTRAPVRDSRVNDVVLPAHRSRAIRLNTLALGEAALGAQVDVSLGRVAVASLGIGREGGIRSSLGARSTARTTDLPIGASAGQAVLALMVPGESPVHLGATLLARDGATPAGGLTEASQGPTTTATYPVPLEGPGSVEVVTQGAGRIVASLRAIGVGHDWAATGGAVEPARSWVVLPATIGEPTIPGLVLVNPGNAPVTVTLRALDPAAPDDVEVPIQPGRVARAPAGFWSAASAAALLVSADGGPILALAASTSLGTQGLSTYALAMGVRVPARAQGG